ncbi:MAG TPA: YidC/Oxa1 family membrane protein insertase [Candidatus Dormibacteraeota bacterium]|nr:YidC/Oxa1 family membrane protein insertase [Candidatus Dormibacteraeota bacterium]
MAATTRCPEKEACTIFLSSPFDIFKPFFTPVHDLWVAIFYVPIQAALSFIYVHLVAVPPIAVIGAYGVAIIVLTIIIRVLLSPLQQFQLVTQRKTMVEQRKLAPQVGELRKKYKKDPQKLNTEMMKLYQEHGVNPLGGLVGCLPLIVQLPILTALYYVFTGFARSNNVITHFLFVPNLNENPAHHLLIPGIPFIPVPAYIVFPLLAAATTFIQSKMLQMPAPLNPTEQELQTLQMQRTMVFISPLMIAWFSLNVPAGLGLYWFVGNCVSIIQQSFVVGWGNLWPSRAKPLPGANMVVSPSKPQPGVQKNGPPPPGATTNINKAKKPKNRARSDRT